MTELPRFHLDSSHFSGPLKEVLQTPSRIEDYLLNFSAYPKITFVGDTYAGKNQIVKKLVYTLGGIYQEDRQGEEEGRTRKDNSYLFLEYGKDSREVAMLILKTVAGDLMRRERFYESPEVAEAEELIVVLKNLKSSTLSNQIRVMRTFMNRLGKTLEGLPAIVTRAKNTSELTPGRINQLREGNFSKVYFVDNPPCKKYSLSTFSEINARAIVETLEESFSHGRLIYFGQEQIPPRLGPFLVPWQKQFPIVPVASSDEGEGEDSSPQERFFRAIFRDRTNIKV